MSKDRYIWLDGEKIYVSEEVYRAYYRPVWREAKQKEVRDDMECSYDFMLEHDFDGQAAEDQMLVDEIVADKLLLDELYVALAELTDDERSLIDALYFKEQTAREYARKADTNHTKVNRRHKSVIEKLRSIQRHSDWEYCGVYADEALTGTKDERPEFQRLLTDCRDGKIDMVITKAISRFARNTVTMLETVRERKLLGIDVYFEKENIHSISGDGEVMLTILASYAQEESRSVSENIKWRVRKRFEKGELVSFNKLYGYDIKKDDISVNEEQSAVVRMIFEDYIGGMGVNRIAKKLNGQGIPAYNGGRWKPSVITQLIKNEKLTGNALLQKKFTADHLTKPQVRNAGQLPQYYAEGTHPAIIDMAIFEKAQAVMAERAEYVGAVGGTKKRTYPFTGKILCENCGKHYKRKIANGRHFWQCSTFLELGKSKCHAKQVPEETLMAVTAEVLGIPKCSSTNDTLGSRVRPPPVKLAK